ncbi:hypothetical protein ACTXT7_002001 [Hymenolepis weldensis]
MLRTTLGGITLFTRTHLGAMNEASNLFEEWGGEDDELCKRVSYIHPRSLFVRFDEGQFYEENRHRHLRDKYNDKFKTLARSSRQSMMEDGLRQIQYTLLEKKDLVYFV